MKTTILNFTKSLSVLLMALFSCLTASAEVQHEYVTVDGFQYELVYDYDNPSSGYANMIYRDIDWETGDFYQIQYDGWNTDSIFYIPSSIGDFPVTNIMGGFGGFKDIKTIHVPPTVINISRYAFAGSSLESIYFVGDYYSNDLAPITFKERDDYFTGWDDYGEGYDTTYYQDNHSEAFRGCERLSSVVFERPVKKIAGGMFRDCPQLQSVQFYAPSYFDPDAMSLNSIGDCAFLNCKKLTHFEMPKSVRVIGNGAFAYCTSLETLDISRITDIGDYAFADCNLLDGITTSPSLQSIGEAAFINCTSLSNMSIPSTITAVPDYAFYNCGSIAHLDLKNVTTFGDRSFAGCYSLTEIDLSKAQSIGEAAFFGGSIYCVVHDEPNYYGTILGIGYKEEGWGTAETTLGSLRKITLGENVSHLFDRTFVGHIPDTITCMAPAPPTFSPADNYNWTFSREAYSNTVLCVPKVVVNDYSEAFGWERFVNIVGLTIMGNGDVNGDGHMSIGDVTALIDMLLSVGSDTSNPVNADVNGDGNLSIADVTRLIDMMLGIQ